MKSLFSMKNVTPVDGLDLNQIMRRKLPTPMLDFLSLFLRKLSGVLGATFFVEVGHLRLDRNVKVILDKLEYLQAVGVVRGHYQARREPFDEPPVYGVQVNLIGNRRTGYSGYGRSYFSYDEAYGPAYGEALERWCVETYAPMGTKLLGVQELKRTGIDLRKLPSPERKHQVAAQKQEYVIADDSVFVCVMATDLTHPNVPTPAPLQWFSFKHAREYLHTGKEPQIHPLVTTGAAAGTSYERAVLGGIYESLERDAFTLYWLKRITPERIDIARFDTSRIRQLRAWVERYNLEAHFLYLPTDFSIHTVLCVITDQTGLGPAVVVDACTDTDLIRCVEKSFLSAVNQRPFMRRKWKELEGRELKTDKLDISTRPFWWYRPDKLPLLDFLLKGPIRDTFPSYKTGTDEENLASIIEQFKTKDYRVLCVDTLPETYHKHLGDYVIGIKVPELIPMHLNEWEKIVTGERLENVPSALGLKVGTTDINDLPHPFS